MSDDVPRAPQDQALAHKHLGDSRLRLGRPVEALDAYDRALALKPDFVEAHVHRGMALKALGRLQEAVAAYDSALALQPNLAVAHNNKGNALVALKQAAAALACFERALEDAPDFVEAHYGRGNALHALRRCEEALASFDRALALRPDYAQALCNRGYALNALRRCAEALADCDRALALKPDLAEAHLNRAFALSEFRRFAEAARAGARAVALNPRLPLARGVELHTRMKICDWADYDAKCAALARDLDAGLSAATPFAVLGLIDQPAAHRRSAELYLADLDNSAPRLPAPRRRARAPKIKLGYFSSDFFNHACAYLMIGLLEQHDRSRFEIHAFSYGPPRRDKMRERIFAAVDEFHDVDALSDAQAALLARDLDIDIAIDCNGHTTSARPGIFAQRAAPVQVNYLGYPGTTGARHVDYILADATIIPEGFGRFYSEKIARLPHTYQATDNRRPIAERRFTRAEFGLPDVAFVFCCFNNNYKITPDAFEVWMRILRQVDGAVLWLLEDTPDAARNLWREAARRGVDARRLVFAPRLTSNPDHLARHRLADLGLDTLPYNAHTTANDALWAGLPMLTCMGQSFPARVAASLLYALELPELVTDDFAAYEALAVALARDPARMATLKSKLARHRLTTPLFDTKAYARHIEAAFAIMHARSAAGEPPCDFAVPL